MSKLLPLFLPAILLAQTRPKPVWKFVSLGRLPQLRRHRHARDCPRRPQDRSDVLLAPRRLPRHLRLRRGHGPPASPHLHHLRISPSFSYLTTAWPDFIEHQLPPLRPARNISRHRQPRDHFSANSRNVSQTQFAAYLDTPRLRAQRDQDRDTAGGSAHLLPLGNESFHRLHQSRQRHGERLFDPTQMAWIRARLAADRKSHGNHHGRGRHARSPAREPGSEPQHVRLTRRDRQRPRGVPASLEPAAIRARRST